MISGPEALIGCLFVIGINAAASALTEALSLPFIALFAAQLALDASCYYILYIYQNESIKQYLQQGSHIWNRLNLGIRVAILVGGLVLSYSSAVVRFVIISLYSARAFNHFAKRQIETAFKSVFNGGHAAWLRVASAVARIFKGRRPAASRAIERDVSADDSHLDATYDRNARGQEQFQADVGNRVSPNDGNYEINNNGYSTTPETPSITKRLFAASEKKNQPAIRASSVQGAAAGTRSKAKIAFKVDSEDHRTEDTASAIAEDGLTPASQQAKTSPKKTRRQQTPLPPVRSAVDDDDEEEYDQASAIKAIEGPSPKQVGLQYQLHALDWWPVLYFYRLPDNEAIHPIFLFLYPYSYNLMLICLVFYLLLLSHGSNYHAAALGTPQRGDKPCPRFSGRKGR
jgi:hypothetical protein